MGIEVALGGWIVTFMIRVRQSDAFSSGMTATGFWLGITVGRVVLGFVTPRIGEKTAISVSVSRFIGIYMYCFTVFLCIYLSLRTEKYKTSRNLELY